MDVVFKLHFLSFNFPLAQHRKTYLFCSQKRVSV